METAARPGGCFDLWDYKLKNRMTWLNTNIWVNIVFLIYVVIHSIQERSAECIQFSHTKGLHFIDFSVSVAGNFGSADFLNFLHPLKSCLLPLTDKRATGRLHFLNAIISHILKKKNKAFTLAIPFIRIQTFKNFCHRRNTFCSGGPAGCKLTDLCFRNLIIMHPPIDLIQIS